MRRRCIPVPARWAIAVAGAATPLQWSCSQRFSVTPVVMPQAAEVVDVPRCPVAGVVPGMACPLEEGTQTMRAKEIVTQLGKSRLSGFVAATAVVGYVMCGGANPVTLACLGVGTYLQGLSANTCNQCIEVENDRLMKRTMKRPLVVGAISRTSALLISTSEFACGTALLGAAISPAVAGLGAVNWMLYVGVYTPLKRVSTTNTWWGAIVGAIPPVMGAAALTGNLALAPVAYPAYLLGAVMFVWQIPHFMSLAFHCRRDYEGAGFKMLAFNHPTRAAVYSVSLAVVMAGLTTVGPVACGMAVEPWFYPPSLAANAAMVFKTVRFYMDPVRYCRSCFVFSYMYLAVILALFTVNAAQPVTRLIRWLDSDAEPTLQPTASSTA